MPSNLPLSSSPKSSDDEVVDDTLKKTSKDPEKEDDKDDDEVPGKGDDGVNYVSGSDDQEKTDGSTKDVNIVGPRINTASTNINTNSLNINTASPIPVSPIPVSHILYDLTSMEETGIFDDAYDDREVGVEADLNNLETTMNVSPIPKTKIHKDHWRPKLSTSNKKND
nr:hypothetical protein [Tanacetum cinerariifolium]